MTQLVAIAAAAAAAACALVAPAAAQLPNDVVAFVTDRGVNGGFVGGYFGQNALYVWASCSVPLFDVTWTGNTLVFSSAAQIYSRAIDTPSSACGTALLNPVPSNVNIAHLATNTTHIYFTDRTSGAIMAVQLTGGAATVIVPQNGEGINGRRLGLAFWGGALFYTLQGRNTTANIMFNSLWRVNPDGTNPVRMFNYGGSQAWWMTDLAISSRINRLWAAEFRNDSNPTSNVQTVPMPINTGLQALVTGIATADEENTFITADDTIPAGILWYTAAHANTIQITNATSRTSGPFFQTMVTVPSSFGILHGISFIPGTDQSAGARMPYAVPSATVSAFPTPGPGSTFVPFPSASAASPSITPSTGSSPSTSPSTGAGSSPSPRGSGATSLNTAVPAVVLTFLAIVAAMRSHE